MGHNDKRKSTHKEKAKRKRGKKFKYEESKDLKLQAIRNKQNKQNPFEEVSNKKFVKSNTTQFKELVSDYKSKNIVNKFKDNRLGEGSTSLTEEEKMKLRFKAQQSLKKTKKSKFLINDDDNNDDQELTLTHKGKKIKENDPIDLDEEVIMKTIITIMNEWINL